MSKIINDMKQLGLTEYEAKAYLTLLENHPVNGYVLSKKSGIPRSRIYEVLDGLVKKQIVFEKTEGKANSYIPLEPSLLTKKLRQNFDMTVSAVDRITASLYRARDSDPEPKILRGRKDIMQMVQILIKEADSRIALSVWDEELMMIRQDLEEAIDRGVLIRGIYLGRKNPLKALTTHRRIERYMAEFEERYIIVIIDHRHVISGVISRGEDSQASWSKDTALINISDDFIVHDVMVNHYYWMLEGEAQIKYETTLDEVRKDYYGYTDEEYKRFPLP